MNRRKFLKVVGYSIGAAAVPYELFSNTSLDTKKIKRLHTQEVIVRVYTNKGRFDHNLPVWVENHYDSISYFTDHDIVFEAADDFMFEKITISPPFNHEIEAIAFDNINQWQARGGTVTIQFDQPQGVLTIHV